MISFFLGTRPEIIKMSPIIGLMKTSGIDFSIIHTNQHFSANMDKQFFDDLKLPYPTFNLKIKQRSHAGMLAEIISKSEKILEKTKPSVVVVQGDTNSVLAGSIVAAKMNIPVAHVEAGLRSYDNKMPEEINRKITDHLSSVLFCPTNNQKEILLGEGVSSKKIFVTGNTIVDAVYRNIKLTNHSKIAASLSSYILLTLHRPSNVDSKDTLREIITSLEHLSNKLNLRVFFPVHPRTMIQIEKFKIKINPDIFIVSEPVGYLEMLDLEKNSRLILTDSGGLQEEACILKVPCVTIRENTERPETVSVGANIIAGTSREEIIKASLGMFGKKRDWVNPYGNGTASEKIISVLQKKGFV